MVRPYIEKTILRHMIRIPNEKSDEAQSLVVNVPNFPALNAIVSRITSHGPHGNIPRGLHIAPNGGITGSERVRGV